MRAELTTRIVTGSEQDSTSCFPLTDDMAGSWCTENPMLSDNKLFDPISGSNLCDELNDLRIPESPISTNHQCSIFRALGDGEKDRCDEGFGVVGLLEHSDLLAKTGSVFMVSSARISTSSMTVSL